MKTLRWLAGLATLATAASAFAQNPPHPCLVRGEAIHWAADYCMLKLETDDEIAVSDCIEEQRKAVPGTGCAAKTQLKRRLCELYVSSDRKRGTAAQCVRDPAFMGRTVRDGGVRG
jgi:hypothetical protein